MRARRLNGEQGFTLLELLMVVVILAILAAIAVPQYIRTAERGRMAEALNVLSSLRQSVIRFQAETGFAPAALAQVDVGDPNNAANMSGTTVYAYTFTAGVFPAFALAAQRQTGPSFPAPPASCGAGGNYTITMQSTGIITGRDCSV